MKLSENILKELIREELQIFNEEEEDSSSWYNYALDLAGFAPLVGEAADLANVIDYARKGDYQMSALSAISLIPVLGDAIGKGSKAAVLLTKLGKGGKAAAKGADAATTSKAFTQASSIIVKVKNTLRENADLINKLFTKLEGIDNEELQKHLPRVKQALQIFMKEEPPQQIAEWAALEEQQINKQLVRKMKAAKLAAREWMERQKEAWRHEKKTTADMSKLIYKQFPVLGQDNAMRLAKGEALVTEEELETLNEELTKTDKDDIKKMISKELDKVLKKEIKDVLEDELSKALNSKATKEEIAEITKKVMKKLYKDLSYHHPYIIDRIKV